MQAGGQFASISKRRERRPVKLTQLRPMAPASSERRAAANRAGCARTAAAVTLLASRVISIPVAASSLPRHCRL